MVPFGQVAENYSGCTPAPPELHARTLGDKEKVVAQGPDVLVIDGDDTEIAVTVCPGEGREIPGHPPLGVPTPGVPPQARGLCATPRPSEPRSSLATYLQESWHFAGPSRRPSCGPRPRRGNPCRQPTLGEPACRGDSP